MRLTRRERAAMELALEVLRHSALITTRTTDGGSEQLSERAIQEAGIALAVGFSGLTRPIVDTEAGWGRLVRARLALYLRARLRLDAGGDETGPWWCCRCGVLRCAAWECSGEPYHQRIRPLWELAPSHGGGR